MERKCQDCLRFYRETNREGYSVCREWDVINGIVKEAFYERPACACNRKKKKPKEKSYEQLLNEVKIRRRGNAR